MIKKCCVCGREFDAKRKIDVVCSDPDCRSARYKEVTARWKKEHYEHVKELNRASAKRRRARKKAEREARAIQAQTFVADGYAERQMQKSLALAGKVRPTL